MEYMCVRDYDFKGQECYHMSVGAELEITFGRAKQTQKRQTLHHPPVGYSKLSSQTQEQKGGCRGWGGRVWRWLPKGRNSQAERASFFLLSSMVNIVNYYQLKIAKRKFQTCSLQKVKYLKLKAIVTDLILLFHIAFINHGITYCLLNSYNYDLLIYSLKSTSSIGMHSVQ